MAGNFIHHDAEIMDIEVVPSGGFVAGNAYLVRDAFGVAPVDADEDGPGELVISGVVILPAGTGTAYAWGQRVNWDEDAGAAGELTHLSVGSEKMVGVSVEAKPSAQDTCEVLLMPMAIDVVPA